MAARSALGRFLEETKAKTMADVNKHLDRAKRYLEKNKVQDAIEEYQAVLDGAPGHTEALQSLGDLYTRVNNPEKAALYYGLLFDRLTESREEAKALALYTRFLKTTPQPPERGARYALLLQRQNRVDEALEQYSSAADRFVTQRREEEALGCRERLAELDPNNPERHMALAELAERVGKTAIAARGFMRAGQLKLAKGELDPALELFERAHRAAPGERSIALPCAAAHLRRGDAAKALELLEPFAAGESEPAFLDTYGVALMRTGFLDRARSALEQFYREQGGEFEHLFELAGRYAKGQQGDQAVQVLSHIQQKMFAARKEGEFTARLDEVAEANADSLPLVEFWGSVYNELNREAKYFDVLVRLFDLYFGAGDLKNACETLQRLVDIDAYDYRNQERIDRLKGKVEPSFLSSITSRLGMAAGNQQTPSMDRSLGLNTSQPMTDEALAGQALDDLLVQAEIFLQYSLQGKAVERLQKIAEMFPKEAEKNERLRNLFQQAHWWPTGLVPEEEREAERPAAAPANRTGVYSAETLRDLAKISEVTKVVYQQTTPRAMLSAMVNEIGKYLKVTRCLAVVGPPGQPPQMAAEFCAPGVEPSASGQIVRLLTQIDRAVPDSLGGLPLEAAVAPVLREMNLASALGVALIDKEIQAPAGMLVVGHAARHKWKPHETYFLQAVGDQMLLGLSHTKLRSLVRNLAVADEKTGLVARGSYLDCLLGETQKARSQGGALALAILQIDRGPDLIRQQGEAMVERHMEQLARAVQSVVPQNNLTVKYTPWSMAFILPETNLEGARNLVEKLRRVAAAVRPAWNGSELTLSAGVVEAVTHPDYENDDVVTDLINRAEITLEEARRKGGDTVVSLGSPGS